MEEEQRHREVKPRARVTQLRWMVHRGLVLLLAGAACSPGLAMWRRACPQPHTCWVATITDTIQTRHLQSWGQEEAVVKRVSMKVVWIYQEGQRQNPAGAVHLSLTLAVTPGPGGRRKRKR